MPKKRTITRANDPLAEADIAQPLTEVVNAARVPPAVNVECYQLTQLDSVSATAYNTLAKAANVLNNEFRLFQRTNLLLQNNILKKDEEYKNLNKRSRYVNR